MSETIGTIDASGNPVWPEKTISGQPLALPVAALLNVAGGFVVLDRNPPQDFDLQAALAALIPASEATAPAPVAKQKKADASNGLEVTIEQQ